MNPRQHDLSVKLPDAVLRCRCWASGRQRQRRRDRSPDAFGYVIDGGHGL